jgi:hypothetical protein
MHSALEVATDVLAVSRLTRLVIEDKITEPFRNEILEHSDSEHLQYFITCPYCVSVWVGAAVAVGLVPKKVRYALALSEATTTIRRVLDSLPTRW